MKVEHEVRLDRNEMSMTRWMCGFMVKQISLENCWASNLYCQLGDKDVEIKVVWIC